MEIQESVMEKSWKNILRIMWEPWHVYIQKSVDFKMSPFSFQHPSMAIVKGAGMVMKAIIEVGSLHTLLILGHPLIKNLSC